MLSPNPVPLRAIVASSSYSCCGVPFADVSVIGVRVGAPTVQDHVVGGGGGGTVGVTVMLVVQIGVNDQGSW